MGLPGPGLGFRVQMFPSPSKDSCFQAFRPKDPITYGFWAMLMLRVFVCSSMPPSRSCNPGYLGACCAGRLRQGLATVGAMW